MEMLPQLQAERQLRAIEAATVPNLNRGGMRTLISKYENRLDGVGRDSAARATPSDLSALGIAVEYVDAEGRPVADGTRSDTMEAQG